MGTGWQVGVGGVLRLTGRASELRPKERSLVAALALTHPSSASTDELIELMWGDSPPASARKSLHNHIARTRHSVPGLIESSGDQYRLTDDVEVTVSGRGELFADLADSPHTTALRRRWIESYITGSLSELGSRVDAADPSVPDSLRMLLSHQPANEQLWSLLMVHVARTGSRRDALLIANEARTELAEFGISPGRDLTALELSIIDDTNLYRNPVGTWQLAAGPRIGDEATETADRVLELGSLLGSFEPDIIASTLGPEITSIAVADVVDRFIDQRVLVERNGRVEFVSADEQESVRSSIGRSRRSLLHRDIGDHLSNASPVDHATVAHHFHCVGEARAAEAARHAQVAGDERYAEGRWHAAAELYQITVDRSTEPATRAIALLSLGRSLLQCERFEEAANALRESVDVAWFHGDPLTQAEATLALVGRAGRGAALGDDTEDRLKLLESAHRHLQRTSSDEGDTTGPEHRRLLVALQRELGFALLLTDRRTERDRLFDQSLSNARQLGDPAELARSLLATRYSKTGPTQIHQRVADAREVLTLPPAAVGHELLLSANTYLIDDLLRIGDHRGANDALIDADHILSGYPHPYWMWAADTWRSVLAVVAGDLERAEQIAHAALASRPGVPEAATTYGVSLIGLRLLAGLTDEATTLARTGVERHPDVPGFQAVLALCESMSGNHSAVELIATEMQAVGQRPLRTCATPVLAFGALGEAVGRSGLGHLAAPYIEWLEPHHAQWIVVNNYGGGGTVWSPVSHALALLHLSVGDPETGRRWLEKALDTARPAPALRSRIAGDVPAFDRVEAQRPS